VKHRGLQPPSATGADRAFTALKAALAATPIVGGSIAELFSAVFLPPLAKRQRAWMEDVAQAVSELQDKGRASFAELRDDPQFLDALIQAGRIAAGTSVELKLASLRNAVASAAVHPRVDPPDQHLFLRFVDEFTEWHLLILNLLIDPDGWFRQLDGSRPDGNIRGLVESAIPDLPKELVSPIWRDLYVRSLVRSERVLNEVYDHKTQGQQITALGGRFLKFIQGP